MQRLARDGRSTVRIVLLRARPRCWNTLEKYRNHRFLVAMLNQVPKGVSSMMLSYSRADLTRGSKILRIVETFCSMPLLDLPSRRQRKPRMPAKKALISLEEQTMLTIVLTVR